MRQACDTTNRPMRNASEAVIMCLVPCRERLSRTRAACRRVDLGGKVLLDAETSGERDEELVLILDVRIDGNARRGVDLHGLHGRCYRSGQLVGRGWVAEFARQELLGIGFEPGLLQSRNNRLPLLFVNATVGGSSGYHGAD